jgi:hypothetical protein
MRAAAAAIAFLAAACGSDPVSVRDTDTGADYNQAELTDALAAYAAAGRTPEAFGALVVAVDALRTGMDDAVSDEAELKLTTQALLPVEAFVTKPAEERTKRLATTIYAFALRRPITAARPEIPADPVDAELRPREGEDGEAYLLRVCAGPLSGDCKHVVPELQGVVIGDLAIQKLTTRARNAMANCATCPNDPAWADMIRRWEALDRDQASTRIRDEQRGAPGNWPAAGPAAGPWPDVPSILLEVDGDLILDGRPVPPAERKGELQMMFAERAAIGLELPPATLVSGLASVIADARAGGVTEVVIAARDPAYPWTLRGYRIAAAGQGRKVFVRKTDTVQVLLRAIDADVDPGVRVRID